MQASQESKEMGEEGKLKSHAETRSKAGADGGSKEHGRKENEGQGKRR
jgi:hypothetical protein